jgi:hypothetical protein
MEIISDPPSKNNSYYNDKLTYRIYPEFIFVFGSNLAGRHGKGAALTAMTDHGAIYGIGTGLINNSYAIPTKDNYLRVLSLPVIKVYIEQFVRINNICDKLIFFVTPVGTGLAGYQHEQIAPLFKGVKNSWLPSSWKEFID